MSAPSASLQDARCIASPARIKWAALRAGWPAEKRRVQAPGVGVKVGFSRNPVKRLTMIQTGCPVKAHIVGLILGDRLLERMLHQRLANYRLSGEWFDEAVLPLLMRIVADPSIVEAAA